jgi:hypothetical protein
VGWHDLGEASVLEGRGMCWPCFDESIAMLACQNIKSFGVMLRPEQTSVVVWRTNKGQVKRMYYCNRLREL